MTGKNTDVSTDLRPPKNAEAEVENVAGAGIGRRTPVSQRQHLRNCHRQHAPSAKCEGRAHGPAFASYWRRDQTFASGTLGTEPRFSLGRGEDRRFGFGRTTGNFSGFGVTGPSRNWKPSLSRPSSSLSTITRTCPPPFR